MPRTPPRKRPQMRSWLVVSSWFLGLCCRVPPGPRRRRHASARLHGCQYRKFYQSHGRQGKPKIPPAEIPHLGEGHATSRPSGVGKSHAEAAEGPAGQSTTDSPNTQTLKNPNTQTLKPFSRCLCVKNWDFKEFCGCSCATRDHEPGGMANRLSAIGVVDSTAGFEALPRQP